MGVIRKKFLRGILFVTVIIVPSESMVAHEPLFGFGPELVRKGGRTIESEIEYERAGADRETVFHVETMYGITEFLAYTIEVPFFIKKEDLDEDGSKKIDSAGLGKIEVRAKYRIYKKYEYGKRDQIVLIGGVKLPTVSFNKKPFLENRSFDFIVGTAAGMETTRTSYFGTIAYDINTPAKKRLDGNRLNITLAAGFRPEPISYYKLDWLFFLEMDAIHTAKDTINRQRDADSGGFVIFLGPTVFVSKRNILLKAGIQAPIVEHVNGKQPKHEYRFAIGLDLHF